MTDLNLDREAWLTEASELILAEKIRPLLREEIKFPFRVSVGYPPRSRSNSNVIAVCIVAEASAEQFNEIFVSPALSDSVAILAALSHELIHYSDNCASGHKNHFARMARSIGLEGKLTATFAGAALVAYLETIVEILGPIPHAAIDLSIAKPKQATRMIKVSCPDENCGFSYRTTKSQIIKISDYLCPACAICEMIAA